MIMSSYLFLDETGDHGLTNIDPNFPLFLLCGCLIDDKNVTLLQEEFNRIKPLVSG